MNYFIAIHECSKIGLDNFFFLYCTKLGTSPDGYIEGSYLFVVEEKSEKFKASISSVEIPSNKTIVLYDSGDYASSSQVFWGLKALGFANVKVLLRVLYLPEGLCVVPGVPPLVPKLPSPYLPFKSEVCMTKSFISNNDNLFSQLVQINYVGFDILDETGNLRDPEDVLRMMNCSGIRFGLNHDTVVFGKKACLGALLMSYVTNNNVSVLLDDLPSRNYSVSSEKTLTESERYDMSNNSLSIDISRSPKKTGRNASKVCNGCLIY